VKPPVPSVAGASCGKHPAVPAVDICARCGSFLCGECVEYFGDATPACASCLPLMKGTPASVRARLSPLLALVALSGLPLGTLIHGRRGLGVWLLSFFLGFSGLALGVQELRLIKAGQAGTRGRRWAMGGVILGTIYALGFGALLIAFATFLYRTYGRAP